MIARYGENDYGYSEAGYGYGVRAFTGFDGLAAVPDLLGWWSVSRRVLARYNGPAIRLRRSSDSTEQDFYGIGPQGEVSTAAVRAFNGWNLLRNSNLFSGAGWTLTGASVSVSSLAAPDGTLTATKVDISIVDVERLAQVVNSGVSIDGITYTGSIWIRGEGSEIGKTVRFRVKRTSGGTANGIIVDHVLTADWQRISATFTGIASNTGVTFSFDGAAGHATSYVIWSSQLEVGSTPTTYEPRTTTGAGDSFLVTLYDQSGLARHFTQSTTTLQPIVCEQGVPVTENGRLAAKFVAATAHRMSIASSTAMFNALHTTGGTILLVGRPNNTANNKRILSNRTSSTGQPGFVLDYSSTEVIAFGSRRIDSAGVAADGLSVSLATSSALSVSANSVIAMTVDPDNVVSSSRGSIWVNGVSAAPANTEANMPFVENAHANMTLGSSSDGTTTPYDGTFSEGAFFSSLISDADRTAWQSRSGTFFTVAIS